jgi:hypothetical protein
MPAHRARSVSDGIQEDESATSGLKLQALASVRVQIAIPSLIASGTREYVRLCQRPTEVTEVVDRPMALSRGSPPDKSGRTPGAGRFSRAGLFEYAKRIVELVINY